jgi:hypothetical protein
MIARGQSISISIGMLDKLIRMTLSLKFMAPSSDGPGGGGSPLHRGVSSYGPVETSVSGATYGCANITCSRHGSVGSLCMR